MQVLHSVQQLKSAHIKNLRELVKIVVVHKLRKNFASHTNDISLLNVRTEN